MALRCTNFLMKRSLTMALYSAEGWQQQLRKQSVRNFTVGLSLCQE